MEQRQLIYRRILLLILWNSWAPFENVCVDVCEKMLRCVEFVRQFGHKNKIVFHTTCLSLSCLCSEKKKRTEGKWHYFSYFVIHFSPFSSEGEFIVLLKQAELLYFLAYLFFVLLEGTNTDKSEYLKKTLCCFLLRRRILLRRHSWI